MNISELESSLLKYVPSGSLDTCIQWIVDHRISMRITKSRNSKYGDYRPPDGPLGHRISVNHDLNKYAFLITFTHEVAHLITWSKHKYRVDPHGMEWKSNFKKLMTPFFRMGVFPKDLVEAVQGYLDNPGSSSCSDLNLMRALSRYDRRADAWTLLEELEHDTLFRTRSGMVFRKGRKMRKNYCCMCVKTRQEYTVNPTTEVQKVDPTAARKTGK
ncbi:MAG: SprT-like domain-containing protein [Bacteroidota bacterium]|jgi:SprT protein